MIIIHDIFTKLIIGNIMNFTKTIFTTNLHDRHFCDFCYLCFCLLVNDIIKKEIFDDSIPYLSSLLENA
jgi:hypothetical protein